MTRRARFVAAPFAPCVGVRFVGAPFVGGSALHLELLLTVALVAGAGCRTTTPAPSTEDTAPAPPAAVDRLADGELLEGSERAFDVPLPRNLRVDGAFVDAVYASGPVPLHPLVQYFRARLRGGELREGESSATFDRAQAAGKPGRSLNIHVITSTEGVRVEIRDLTPPVLPELPNEAARWQRVGLTPDGHLADPQHIE
jgi:hypothetical protein